jgi:DNA repair protein RadC
MTLAENLVQAVDAKGLNLKVEDLEHLEGMGAVKAMIVVAALEFARRRIKPGGLKITTPANILPLIRHFADRKQEHFLCITINGANEVLNVRVVSIGLLDRTPVHPREVFADAITDRASGIILAHNHPEGGVEPSAADADVTRRIKQAGEIVGIHLLDHIIFNPTAYFSFLEEAKL